MMMKIKVLKTFLDGRDRFEPGEERAVPDNLGSYFCDNGWAIKLGDQKPAAKPAAAPVELQIDGMHHNNDMEDAG